MQICATLVCNTKNSDEQSIICVNYVLRYTADYPTSQQNQNHNRHYNRKNRNHRITLTTISILTLSSADRSTPAQSWLVNRSEFRYLVLMVMKRRQTYLQNHGEIISTIVQVDELLSSISYQVDQPPMQIKSDHSDDDHVGIRNGSPESLKGLILFLLMLIMLIQFQNDERMDKNNVQMQKYSFSLSGFICESWHI